MNNPDSPSRSIPCHGKTADPVGSITLARTALTNAQSVLDELLADEAAIERIGKVARQIAACFRAGGKLLACGNGGSACDAMHLCEEFTGRFRQDREPLPALACIDPGHLTCAANDYGYEEVFARWVKGLGKPGDCLVLLSTSGNSANVIRAAQEAGSLGITRIALLGNKDAPRPGGTLAGLCEHAWICPGTTADRVQELHMLIGHTLIECVEHELDA